MDSQAQLKRTNAHHHQAEEPIKIHHPEDEEHNQKGPSKVIKKVKEKAKKIKNVFTKHGHGHEHDHGEHILDHHDLDEEDDDDDEDRQIHRGAPARGKAHAPVKEEISPPGSVVSSSHTKPSEPIRGMEPVRGSNASHGQEAHSRPVRSSGVSEKEERREAATLTPHNTPVSSLSATEHVTRTFVPGEQRRVNIERPSGLVEDPTASGGGSGSLGGMSNYQSKVADPTGKAAGEIGTAETPSSAGGYGKLPFFSGGETGTETENQQGQDKGVSAREYLTEKLKPGEEDKALSEVIAEKLHLEGGGGENTTSPAKKGIVTQSEEVEKRLGGFSDQRSEQERKHGEAFAEECEGGMVDKLREAVTSWVSGTTEEAKQKSTESVQDSSQSVIDSAVGNIGFSGSGQRSGGNNSGSVPVQRRFQESGN